MTFALGRGVEYYDAPAVRKIVRDARERRLPLLVADLWASSRARRFR